MHKIFMYIAHNWIIPPSGKFFFHEKKTFKEFLFVK